MGLWASYVKLVDVVGNGTDLDSAGNPIYDPYPNDDGFNAAGVGVLSMVPEPASAVLLVLGGTTLVLGFRRRGRRRREQADSDLLSLLA